MAATKRFADVLLTVLFVGLAGAKAETPVIPLGVNADLGGRRLLPDDSPWHEDVSKAPVDPNSVRILARIGLDTPVHPDFGAVYEGVPLGIQYVVVAGTQAKVPVTFTVAAEESDPGPYPVPRDAPIEGGPKGDGDRHVLVLDRDAWKLWELFNAFPAGIGWKADGGAVWDLKVNQVRQPGWTSADAAGLPILPGLIRYDEIVGAQALRHAVRFTVPKTRQAYVPPASHWASEAHDSDLPPMGMRLRLKPYHDISGFSPEAQIILQGLKTYGMILADNGSAMYLGGAHDPRWNDDALHGLGKVTAKDFEVIEMRGVVSKE